MLLAHVPHVPMVTYGLGLSTFSEAPWPPCLPPQKKVDKITSQNHLALPGHRNPAGVNPAADAHLGGFARRAEKSVGTLGGVTVSDDVYRALLRFNVIQLNSGINVRYDRIHLQSSCNLPGRSLRIQNQKEVDLK